MNVTNATTRMKMPRPKGGFLIMGMKSSFIMTTFIALLQLLLHDIDRFSCKQTKTALRPLIWATLIPTDGAMLLVSLSYSIAPLIPSNLSASTCVRITSPILLLAHVSLELALLKQYWKSVKFCSSKSSKELFRLRARAHTASKYGEAYCSAPAVTSDRFMPHSLKCCS